jgi:hypothetical protein
LKKFLLSLLLFTGAAFAVPESPDQLKKLEDEFRLECDTYGEPSCISRFTAMAGCTFVFAMNSGKTTQEALNIADELFTSVMRGNKIGIEAMFTSKDLVKPEIRSEAIERMKICSAHTSSAVAAMLKELSNTNEDPPPKLIEMATADFPYFWMRSLEDIRQGR